MSSSWRLVDAAMITVYALMREDHDHARGQTAAGRHAAQRGTTLSAVIEEALRAKLSVKTARPERPFRLVTFRGEGVHEGVDLDRTSELLVEDDVRRYRQG